MYFAAVFVNTLMCASLVVLVLKEIACCRHFLFATYVNLPSPVSCQFVHVSVSFLTFVHGLMLTIDIMLCHSVTVLLGFGKIKGIH